MREYKAMHGDNFLSSWVREDLGGKDARRKVDKETREEVSRSGKKREERRNQLLFDEGV